MDSAIDSAFLHIQRELETITNEERFLVGISGIPGSGKSCKCPFEQHILSYVSVAFTSKLFDKLINSGMNAGVISMDGWHYTRDVARIYRMLGFTNISHRNYPNFQ